ncbi:Cathepsin L-like peptidase 1 [Frankliniella occidentalis]|uniref:Procathepsin L-like n=1 Tax=Frankliniella occidentalis TaxID=133901 RepID=A0A6J1SGH0_FRAOC|nr:procathepsin L-like [Frankliniella occidentalis]KAE8743916.1 Cathepsin L-like peptidase 1 [Frankliniella occidentalis]
MNSLVILVCAVAAVAGFQDESRVHWEDFKAMHHKRYPNPIEDAFRAKIFNENAVRIAKHNELHAYGKVSFKVGYNQFADMHTHEVTEKLNGFRMDLKRRSGSIHRASNDSKPFSRKVDWRTKGLVTPIKDQGQCGSCWSFSATGSLEGQLFKKTGKLVSLSEQNLVDCSSKYGNEGCNGGVMDSAFEYVKANGGIDSEETYPYTAQDGRCLYKSANSVGVNTGYTDVNPTENDLRDAVEKVGPVSVAIDASHWSFQMYASGIYQEPACSSDSLDHGVLAVGYGSDWPNKDFWLVKNSWGDSWGEGGYIKMARNKNNNCGIATMASYPTV